jgi:glycosyltransferase involved in cell wall biosynthesis
MKLYVVMPTINCLELTQAAIESIGSMCKIILIDNGSTDGTPRWGEKMDGEQLLGRKSIKYVRNNERKSVSVVWNQGIRMAFEDPECEYVAVLNNDIVLHPKTLENLMRFMDKTGYLMVTGDNIKDKMSIDVMRQMELPMPFTDFDTWPIEGWRAEGPDFSCFMISRETIRVIGWFDENFEGAYCEDQDYHARCMMAREHIKKHNDQNIPVGRIHFKRLSTAPYYHYASQTLVRNPELRHDITIAHGRNQGYYLRKFGAEHPETMDGKGYQTPFGDATKSWRDW